MEYDSEGEPWFKPDKKIEKWVDEEIDLLLDKVDNEILLNRERWFTSKRIRQDADIWDTTHTDWVENQITNHQMNADQLHQLTQLKDSGSLGLYAHADPDNLKGDAKLWEVWPDREGNVFRTDTKRTWKVHPQDLVSVWLDDNNLKYPTSEMYPDRAKAWREWKNKRYTTKREHDQWHHYMHKRQRQADNSIVEWEGND